tara:strand:- start:5415 stop:6803 length:1389 start_codon:yes stop_codon:yes gene_type:complete
MNQISNSQFYNKSIALITLLFCSYFINGQVVKFSGKILNPNSKKISVRGKEYYKVIMIDDNGYFSDTLDIKSGDFSLSDFNESTALYLQPGYDIFLTLDTKAFDETIVYKGIGERPNNFLAKYFLYNENNSLTYREIKSMSESEYFTHEEEYFKGVLKLLANSTVENLQFENQQKMRFEYNRLTNILNKSADAYFDKTSSIVTQEFINQAIDKVDFKDTIFYNENNYYKSFINTYFVLGLVANNQNCFELFENHLNQNQRKRIISLISMGVSFYNDKDITPYYEALKKLVDDKNKLSNFTQSFNQIKSLSKGNPSPGFKYKSIGGEMVSLKDLQGKLVYIDVWATWCGPCRAQIPFLKELEEHYRDKDIAFVSISIDNPKDESKWKKMVEEEGLKGIQLIADNAWKSSFATDYVIRGIPRFILIDKKGDIISPFAPQPATYSQSGEPIQNEEINDMIDQYLN